MYKTSVYLKKIYYHDTDAGGVVYYGNYLQHLEEARTEHLAQCGIDKQQLSRDGVLFVVARVEINYRSPARYLETVQIGTVIKRISRSAIVFEQLVRRDDTVLVEANVTAVCIGTDFKSRQLPEDIKQALRTEKK